MPTSEYLKIYNALFLSHLSYCISSWGGIPKYRLNKIFSTQKRCVRLLFGKVLNYDHEEYYMTCARTRPYSKENTKVNFELEHTKPLFNDNNILNLENIFSYHTFLEVFKTLKFRSPTSLLSNFNFCPANLKLLLMLPAVRLEVSKHNFTYQASLLWNNMKDRILKRSSPEPNGIIIPGSETNSDLSANIVYVKKTLKSYLLTTQCTGDLALW